MKQVTDFLSKFKKISPPDDSLRKTLARAITNVARVPVSEKDIRIQNMVAFVRASSIGKSVIRASLADILAELVHELPKAHSQVRDIR